MHCDFTVGIGQILSADVPVAFTIAWLLFMTVAMQIGSASNIYIYVCRHRKFRKHLLEAVRTGGGWMKTMASSSSGAAASILAKTDGTKATNT